jgi:hypothetical protein
VLVARSIEVAFTIFTGLMFQPAGPSCKITAHVVDQAGNPIEGATVWMDPQTEGVRVFVVPACLTDQTGTCSFPHLEPAIYQVSAMKESEGYPNLGIPLYASNAKPVLEKLTPERCSANLSLNLGPKAAAIVVSVIDKTTGKPVTNPSFILRMARDPNNFLGTGPDARSKILIPPDVEITVEVQAEGYRPWRLAESIPGRPGVLNLRSGEVEELSIQLEPKVPE